MVSSDLTRLDGLGDLPGLRSVSLANCGALTDIGGLVRAPNVEVLDFTGCSALEQLDALVDLEALRSVDLRECPRLHWSVAPRLYTGTGVTALRAQIRGGEAAASAVGDAPARKRSDAAMISRLLRSMEREEVEKGLELAAALGDPAFWAPYAEGADVTNNGSIVCGYGVGSRVRVEFRTEVALWALRGSGRLANVRRLNLTHFHDGRGGVHIPSTRRTFLSAIDGLVGLEWLCVGFPEGTQNVDALRTLVGLRSLTIEGTPNIENIEGLRGMVNLEALSLRALMTQDLQPLAGMKQLQTLHLHCAAEDITPLGSCVALTDLTLACRSRNLDPLAANQALRRLKLDGWSSLEQVKALTQLPNLETLTYERCPCIENGARRGYMTGEELAAALQWLREN